MPVAAARRAAPLSARLAALVVVPLIALAVISVERIRDDRAATAEASALVADVELQQDVAAVLPPAHLEWIALAGLAAVDELGLPRPMVQTLTGLDFEGTYRDNQIELDRALDVLLDEHADALLPDGSVLRDRLLVLRGALEAQRALSAERRATAADVDGVYGELDDLLALVLTIDDRDDRDRALLHHHRFQLDALGNALVSAGELSQVLLDGILAQDADPVARAVVAARHDAHLSFFESALDDDERAVFRSLVTVRRPAPSDGSVVPVSVDGSSIERAARSVLAQLDYLDALGEYSDGFHERTADIARGEAARADDDARNTTIFLVAVAAFTLALSALAAWSILRPVRRLTGRARAVSAGVLHHEPLPLRGPRDVRALTDTLNEMAATLGRVNRKIGQLADGDASNDELDELPGAIGVSFRQSVAHLARVTNQLHRSEALASAIVAQADDAIWTVNDEGVVLSANAASERLTGVGADDQVGRPIARLLSQTTGEADVVTRPGEGIRALVARSVVDAGDDQVTAVIAHDISERSRFEERLAYQAKHDALTGLPNRFAVLEHLRVLAAEHPGHVAVLYIDLDGFKSVNDVQGHAVGDQVLNSVAGTLARTVRSGEFIGRLGGDEFVVITHRFDQVAEVMALGHRLIREIEIPHQAGSKLFSLSASVGVAVPGAGMDPLDMIGQADSAVYQAKDRGRGMVELFDREMQLRIDRESELEMALRNAVTNAELELHLQPVADIESGRMTEAEALVRWHRPGFGLIPPGEFIAVAERSTLIVEIERWVLMRACELLAGWAERFPGERRGIAVNISGRHLVDGDLIDDIDAVLDLTGADPTLLTLELTETQLLHDVDRATTMLDALRSRGLTIAIDDFGTGYSSMTYLRELPVDVLKIDRSFVARSTEHGFDATVIEAVLTIARTLDLHVVAEGVETDDQLAFVRARGCDAAQGFLFARPMPIEQAEAALFATVDAAG